MSILGFKVAQGWLCMCMCDQFAKFGPESMYYNTCSEEGGSSFNTRAVVPSLCTSR
jgi:hypothetical protein